MAKVTAEKPMPFLFVLDRGYVLVGRIDDEKTDTLNVGLTDAAIIRTWGTQEGLGQLALQGRQTDTVFDLEPDGTTLSRLFIIRQIPCVSTEWHKWETKKRHSKWREGKKQSPEIFICDRGYVHVGRVDYDQWKVNHNKIVLNDCSIIRTWGTEEGIGQLAFDGPRKETIFDREPDGVELNPFYVIRRLPCSGAAWDNWPSK